MLGGAVRLCDSYQGRPVLRFKDGCEGGVLVACAQTSDRGRRGYASAECAVSWRLEITIYELCNICLIRHLKRTLCCFGGSEGEPACGRNYTSAATSAHHAWCIAEISQRRERDVPAGYTPGGTLGALRDSHRHLRPVGSRTSLMLRVNERAWRATSSHDVRSAFAAIAALGAGAWQQRSILRRLADFAARRRRS